MKNIYHRIALFVFVLFSINVSAAPKEVDHEVFEIPMFFSDRWLTNSISGREDPSCSKKNLHMMRYWASIMDRVFFSFKYTSPIRKLSKDDYSSIASIYVVGQGGGEPGNSYSEKQDLFDKYKPIIDADTDKMRSFLQSGGFVIIAQEMNGNDHAGFFEASEGGYNFETEQLTFTSSVNRLSPNKITTAFHMTGKDYEIYRSYFGSDRLGVRVVVSKDGLIFTEIFVKENGSLYFRWGNKGYEKYKQIFHEKKSNEYTTSCVSTAAGQTNSNSGDNPLGNVLKGLFGGLEIRRAD